MPEGVPFLVISNVSSGTISFENTRYVPPTYYEALDDSRKPETGDLLFTVTGSFGIPVVVDTNMEFCFQRHIALLKPLVDVGYLWWAVQSPSFFNYCDLKATGTAQRTVSLSTLRSGLLPIPPEAEQARILSFMAELLPHVDEYGALEDARERLGAELPDRLRKAILQLAVQGKLVEQNPVDEPASVLLDRIRAERAALVKAGKLKAPKGGESVIYRSSDGGYYEKRGKGEPVSIDDEIPFDIPESWEWARLGTIVNIVSARRVHQSDWQTKGVPFYRAREIVKLAQSAPIDDALFISESLFETLSASGVPQAGDLMVTGVGTIGISYIVQESDHFYYKDASVLCFENRMGMRAEYLQLLLQSDFMLNQIRTASSGTTVATITMKNAVDFFAPVPPVEEQRRIVERYHELVCVTG